MPSRSRQLVQYNVNKGVKYYYYFAIPYPTVFMNELIHTFLSTVIGAGDIAVSRINIESTHRNLEYSFIHGIKLLVIEVSCLPNVLRIHMYWENWSG